MEIAIPVIGTVIQWILTTMLHIDKAFFIYGQEVRQYVVIVKVLYFLFLLVMWCFCAQVVRKVREKNQMYLRGLQFFLVYFSCTMLLLIILWPGTWAWDDLVTLRNIQHYNSFNPWQHILTGLYQDIMLQILPFPGGIILLQNVWISLIVAFSLTKIESAFHIRRLKNWILDILLKLIPFFLPPILMYQFSGYRIGLYIYLELAMLVVLVCGVKDKIEWRWKYVLLLAFLTVIVAAWRTESIFYVPCVCGAVVLIDDKVLPSTKSIVCVVAIMTGYVVISLWQTYSLGNSSYRVISLLGPGAELVRVADKEKDMSELEAIDKVLDINVIYDNPSYNGEGLFWETGVVRSEYTVRDYKKFQAAIVKLAVKYPKVVISERWNLFLTAVGARGETINNVAKSVEAFEERDGFNAVNQKTGDRWIAQDPVLKRARTRLIYMLGGDNPHGTRVIWLQRLVWNAIIPIVALLYIWGRLILKKKWYFSIICSAVVIRIPIVILTEPSSWFMYFLSFYLLGYVCLICKLWICYSKIAEREGNKIG